MSQVHAKLFYYTNEAMCFLLYIPFLAIVWTAFTICNLAFLPLSYAMFTIRLLVSIIDQDTIGASVKRFLFVFVFVFLAPPFLCISYVADFFIFLGNLFTKPLVDDFKTEKHKKFNKESLQLFDSTVNEMLTELKIKKQKAVKNGEDITVFVNKYGNYQNEFPLVNKNLQGKFLIMDEIQKIIYDQSPSKFVYNSFTKKNQIAPIWMSKINDFNTLKSLVGKTSNGRTGIVDISLLKSFVEQIKLKTKILGIQKKYGEINLTRSED